MYTHVRILFMCSYMYRIWPRRKVHKLSCIDIKDIEEVSLICNLCPVTLVEIKNFLTCIPVQTDVNKLNPI